MFQLPPEDIGVPCQQEEFDLDLLRKCLQDDPDVLEHGMEELRRIPLIRKTAAVADIMDLAEIEEKVDQFCTLPVDEEFRSDPKFSLHLSTQIMKSEQPIVPIGEHTAIYDHLDQSYHFSRKSG